MNLSELKPARGSRKKAKRVGRGPGSGSGKTSGRGHKGQKSRSGGSLRAGFEGGQMPMQRRLPKRGFVNIFKKQYSVINIRDIAALSDLSEITPEVLISRRLVKNSKDGVKLLGVGIIDRAVNLKVHAISDKAKEKITAAGGTVEVI